MLFISRVMRVSLSIATFFVQRAYGQKNSPVDYYVETANNDWPDIYYLLFGIGAVAVVLFVMAVMTEPDDLP